MPRNFSTLAVWAVWDWRQRVRAGTAEVAVGVYMYDNRHAAAWAGGYAPASELAPHRSGEFGCGWLGVGWGVDCGRNRPCAPGGVNCPDF